MNFQDRWLALAETCLQNLRDNVSGLGDQLPEQRLVFSQISQIELLTARIRKDGLFSVAPERSLLLATVTRESFSLDDSIISGVAYLFDRHARAFRLGIKRAETVLVLKEKA